MRTFIWTTIFRIVILLWWRIYLSNYQSDALYNFLNISNPSTKAVTECYSGFVEVGSGFNAKLDMILQKLEVSSSTVTTGTASTWTGTNTGTINQIFYVSGSKSN